MDIDHLEDGAKPYWTKHRRELIAWLNDRAPSFTEGYAAAVRLLHEDAFPARVHLICHVIRDIYRNLPVALDLPAALGKKSMPRPAEVFPRMVKDLAEKWQNFPPIGNADSPTSEDIPVSAQVHCCVKKIVEKRIAMGDQPSVGKQLAIALFHSADRQSDEFIHPWIIEAFDEEYKFFVKRAHLVGELKKVPSDDGLTDKFKKFERAFHSLVGGYFTGKEELDEILRKTNTTTD